MRFCGDPALSLRIREEMNGASQESFKEFRAICRSFACAGPSYRRRGTTARGLVEGDRRQAWGELTAEAGIGAFEPDDKSIKALRYWRAVSEMAAPGERGGYR